MRQPPKFSASFDVSGIWRIDRRDGSSSCTYYLSHLTRVILGVEGRNGHFVRYDGQLYPIHPKAEFAKFVKEARKNGAIFAMPRGSYLDLAKHAHHPFLLLWERPVGAYR